jgi:uncharacterized membrane protein
MTTATPRSVAEYLEQLRAALAGADPALVQDALYDAEEHLRGELREHRGMPEADVLAKIVGSYGAPEEVAEIYVDKENVGADPRAYSALFYMLLSLATGIFYFTWTVAGLSLSLGLSILIFGIVVAVLFFGTTRVLSLVEGRIVEVMLGERMPRRPLYPPREGSVFKRIGGMFKDPRTWSTLLYFVLMLPLGIVYFTLAFAGTVMSLSFILVPLVHLGWMLGLVQVDWADHIHLNEQMDVPWQLADPLLFVLGIVLLFGLLHLARGIGRFQGGLAKALLVN